MYNGILGFVSFNWNSELFWPTSPQSLHPMTSGMTILFASASSIFLTLQMSYFHLRAQGSQSVTDSEAYPAPQHMCTLTHSPPPPTLNQPRYFKPCFDLLCISVTLFLSVFIFIFFFRWWAHCFEPSGSTFPLPLTFLHASVTSRHVAQSRLDGLHRSGSFAVAGGHRLSHLCSSTLSPASAGVRWNSSCFFCPRLPRKQLSSAIWCGGGNTEQQRPRIYSRL